ncbi:MAG: L,D-transpeptidase/peptidoglycan binding protein [Lachnospiraceae bacterium]|nr:L,D-transpeptidase/peptidoglycan binding protein [Lachnospiraceae bacterium]
MEEKLQTSETTEKMVGKKKRPLGIILVIAGLFLVTFLAVVYLSEVQYYREHYFKGTMINGMNFGRTTAVAAEEALSTDIVGFELKLSGRDGLTDSIRGYDIGLNYDSNGAFQNILDNQNEYLWFLEIFKDHVYTLEQSIVYDRELLADRIDALSFFQVENISGPQSAYISDYAEEIKGFRMIAHIPGNVMIKESVVTPIEEAVQSLKSELDLSALDCYEVPEISDADLSLNRLLEQLNLITGTNITYLFGEDRIVLDGNTIHQWLSIKNGEVILDETQVYEYVKNLAKQYDTYGKKHKFTTTNGEELTLPSAYGWRMDKDAETEALLELIYAGAVEEREPVYSITAANRGKDNIGDSYVEIDLSSQHLYLYLNNELFFESDFVSGDVLTGNTTPEGVFAIKYKRTEIVLRGDDYETPVQYWMPFNGNIGMHDATWRRNFGGTIYLTNGSHGCINLPYTAAETIYNNIYKGLPVVCYYASITTIPPPTGEEETEINPNDGVITPEEEPNYVTEGEVWQD